MKNVFSVLRKIEIYTAAACFLGCTFIMFISAFFRLARHPLNWSLDIAMFLAAWSVFLAADCALERGRLVNVDIFVNLFPKKVQKVCQILSYVIILVFLGACVWYGSHLTYTTRMRAFQGIPGFSYSWVTVSVPVCFTFMIFTVIGKIKKIISPSEPENTEEDMNLGVF